MIPQQVTNWGEAIFVAASNALNGFLAAIPLVIDRLGDENIMFETDYPHPTCLYPDPLERVAEGLEGVSEASQRKLLQDNAAKLYRIPLPA